MKILHTADIHLREYGDERWQTLKTLIDIGKKEKIEVFAISGDLFDEKIDAENLRPKIREIFSNNGFNIVLIPGNHDHDVYKDMYFGEKTSEKKANEDTCHLDFHISKALMSNMFLADIFTQILM